MVQGRSYLEIDASLEQPVLDLGQLVVAEVEDAEPLQVLELARAEDGVEVVAEEVVAEGDDLERVLDAVEEALRQPPDLVVAKVGAGQRQVARREELRAQRLEAGAALAELLDVEPKESDPKALELEMRLSVH